jgi:hypothetical protein
MTIHLNFPKDLLDLAVLPDDEGAALDSPELPAIHVFFFVNLIGF